MKTYLLILFVLLFVGCSVDVEAGPMQLNYENGGSVRIDGTGYESVVFYFQEGDYLGLHGLSIAKAKNHGSWDIAVLHEVAGEKQCSYVIGMNALELNYVVKDTPLLRELGIDAKLLYQSSSDIKWKLTSLTTDPIKSSRDRDDRKIDIKHASWPEGMKISGTYVSIDKYLQHAFRQDNLSCKSQSSWQDFINEQDFYGDKAKEKQMADFGLALKGLEKQQKINTGNITNLVDTANLIKSGLSSAVESDSFEFIRLIKALQEPGGEGSVNGDTTHLFVLSIANAVLITFAILSIFFLTRQFSEVKAVLGKVKSGEEVDASQSAESKHKSSKTATADWQSNQGHHNEQLATQVELIGAVNTFVRSFNHSLTGKITEVIKAARGIQNTIIRIHNLKVSTLRESKTGSGDYRASTLPVVKIEGRSYQPHECFQEVIDKLSKGQVGTAKTEQLDYSEVQEKIESLYVFIICANAAISDYDSQLRKLADQVTEEKIIAASLQREKDEFDRNFDRAEEERKKAVDKYRKNETELIELTTKMKEQGEQLQQIITAFGYMDSENESRSQMVFFTDLLNSPEHLRYGFGLICLQKYLADCGRLDTPVYRACRLDNLYSQLADTSNLDFFAEGASQESIEGQWKTYLWLIYRANLLVKTYWPQQESELQQQLGDCMLSVGQLLRKKGIYPHALGLLGKFKLIDDEVIDAPNSPINQDLVSLPAFKAMVNPDNDNPVIYCDVGIWGYNTITETGIKNTELISKLIAKDSSA